MKKIKATKIEDYRTEVYRWKFKDYGLFEATLINGKLESVEFCKNGSSKDESLFSRDVNFLKAVYQSLGELLEIIDKNK